MCSVCGIKARSIPACAGEPYRRGPYGSIGMVYPRVCGGTHWRHDVIGERLGLSPRVRGNPFCGSSAA